MAKIDFVCHADHTNDTMNTEGPTITLNEGLWSYCGRGACEHHEWERVPTRTLAEIQMEWNHVGERRAKTAPVAAGTPKTAKRG